MTASAPRLLTIVGTTGSGKSSLLSAILGEIQCVYGAVAVNGRVAYVGQQPFIQNATVRENITFGSEFSSGKYEATLRTCCLEHDLAILPSGDMTEIGERGINISGGEKIPFLRAYLFF